MAECSLEIATISRWHCSLVTARFDIGKSANSFRWIVIDRWRRDASQRVPLSFTSARLVVRLAYWTWIEVEVAEFDRRRLLKIYITIVRSCFTLWATLDLILFQLMWKNNYITNDERKKCSIELIESINQSYSRRIKLEILIGNIRNVYR